MAWSRETLLRFPAVRQIENSPSLKCWNMLGWSCAKACLVPNSKRSGEHNCSCCRYETSEASSLRHTYADPVTYFDWFYKVTSSLRHFMVGIQEYGHGVFVLCTHQAQHVLLFFLFPYWICMRNLTQINEQDGKFFW